MFLLYLRHRWQICEEITDDLDPLLNTVDLPMSRQDIADFLGLKKETVSRSFTQLDDRGLINRPDSHKALVTDLDGLRELAGIMDFSSPLRLAVRR